MSDSPILSALEELNYYEAFHDAVIKFSSLQLPSSNSYCVQSVMSRLLPRRGLLFLLWEIWWFPCWAPGAPVPLILLVLYHSPVAFPDGEGTSITCSFSKMFFPWLWSQLNSSEVGGYERIKEFSVSLLSCETLGILQKTAEWCHCTQTGVLWLCLLCWKPSLWKGVAEGELWGSCAMDTEPVGAGVWAEEVQCFQLLGCLVSEGCWQVWQGRGLESNKQKTMWHNVGVLEHVQCKASDSFYPFAFLQRDQTSQMPLSYGKGLLWSMW